MTTNTGSDDWIDLDGFAFSCSASRSPDGAALDGCRAKLIS
jgi:hypothetical protein